jgi:hypothetical protein
MLFLSFVQYKYVDSGHAKAGNGAWGGLCGYCVALHFGEDYYEDTHLLSM